MLKTRVLLLPLVIILVASLLAIGCAPAAAPGEVIQLKYADQNPETGWEGTHAAQPWTAQIEKATNGRVKITGYYAQSLFKGVDAWQSLKSDVADIAWCFHGYWAGMTPLADVLTLPFLPFKSAEQASGIFWQLMEKYPSMAKEFADNKVLVTYTSSPYLLITTKKQVKTLEDLKGLKIRVTGGPPTEQMKLLGAIPQSIGMPDTYENLQKGVIDGMAIPWEALYSFRQYEVAKYWTIVPLHTVYFTQSMNLNSWNNLPADVQKQVMSVCGLSGSKFWGKNMFDSAAAAARDEIKKQGIQISEYTLPQSELDRWTQIAGKPLWDQWIADMKAKGMPEAEEIFNTTLDMIK